MQCAIYQTELSVDITAILIRNHCPKLDIMGIFVVRQHCYLFEPYKTLLSCLIRS